MNFNLTARPVLKKHWVLTLMVMVMALSSVSCGMFGKKKEKPPAYYTAREVPNLVIPEGLDRPIATNALMIQTPPAPLPARELQSLPPRVTSQSNTQNENASIRWGTAGIYLHVADSQESVNRRLGFAAKRSGFSYREQGTGNGLIVQFVHQREKTKKGFFKKLAFWRDDGPNYSGEYLITTEADGENTRIYLRNPDGSDTDQNAAEFMLVKLDERLG